MVTFCWDNKYEDPMQATLALHSRRPLPRVPTPGRTTKPNEMPNPISPLNELNCTSTRTPRLPLLILNRSTSRSPPTPNSNAKRTKTVSLPRIGNLPSLYTHSNRSGELRSKSRSPIALGRSSPTLSIPTRLDRQRTSLQTQHRLPPISLLRSRRKLWKKYWLVVDLPIIPELNENVHEIESESVHQLRSRSVNLTPRKPPPSEPQSTPIVRQLSKYPPRLVTERLLPPPPELDDDNGSESSSSDEDLDAYEFDLSSCSPSYVERPVDAPKIGIYDRLKDSRTKQHSDLPVRVANHLEPDISSIYESITRARIESL